MNREEHTPTDNFLEATRLAQEDLAKARAVLARVTPQVEELTRAYDEKLAEYTTSFTPFLQKKWFGEHVDLTPLLIDPTTQDYNALKDDIRRTKFGEYTLNPDMLGIDFNSYPKEKIRVLPLAEFVGKPLYEVAQHVIDTYGTTHHIPGIELWQWLIEKYDSAPADVKDKYKELADGNHHFFLGSLVQDSVGHWSVPWAYRSGVSFGRLAGWLTGTWVAESRVVLLEM